MAKRKRRLAFAVSKQTLFEISFESYRDAENADDSSEKCEYIYVVSRRKMKAMDILKAFALQKKKVLNPDSIEGHGNNGSYARATYTFRNRVYTNGRKFQIRVDRKTESWGKHGGVKLAYL